MREAVRETLRARLASGDRKALGEASVVAREILDDPGLLLPLLVDCLDDADATVVSHAAHAAMQVSRDRPALFQAHGDRLLDVLDASAVWETGEQLPKILARLELEAGQAERLGAILRRRLEGPSAFAAASALSAIVALAERHLWDPDEAKAIVGRALSSPRKAVAARARRLLGPAAGKA